MATAIFPDGLLSSAQAATATKSDTCATCGQSSQASGDPPDLPASTVTIPDQPLATDSNVKQEPIPPAKHRRAPKANQQVASAPPPAAESPGVSAIGQLSSGEPSDQRHDTEDSITATERGLNGLGRALNDQEQKTAAQIREYIKQAREALLSGDVDGAKTLAAKAKVLLGELSQ